MTDCDCKIKSSSLSQVRGGQWSGQIYLPTGAKCKSGICPDVTQQCQVDGKCYGIADVMGDSETPRFSNVFPITLPACTPAEVTGIPEGTGRRQCAEYALAHKYMSFYLDVANATVYYFSGVPAMHLLYFDAAHGNHLYVQNSRFSGKPYDSNDPCSLNADTVGWFSGRRIILVLAGLALMGLFFYFYHR